MLLKRCLFDTKPRFRQFQVNSSLTITSSSVAKKRRVRGNFNPMYRTAVTQPLQALFFQTVFSTSPIKFYRVIAV